jgi:putative FmdB family regulatory protein
MPLYEYLCKKCGHRFEKIQKFSDRLIKKCPECGGAVEQVISAPAVQFKGSGWYVTDYAKKPSGGSSSGTGSGSASSNNGDAAKSEAKSDAKSESKSDSGAKKEDKPKTESKKTDKK